MATKRSRDESAGEPSKEKQHKKQRKGFQVGPDNLPDGQHRRKAQQIKRNLIEKAKIKKEYAKVKSQRPVVEQRIHSEDDQPRTPSPEPTNEPHPERQVLIDDELAAPTKEPQPLDNTVPAWRQRRPKAIPFQREQREAERNKTEAEERRKAREEAQRQRQVKIEEREKFRRAMAKARTGGKNGQRKLGRESLVLLDKVKRIVAEG